MNPLEPNGSPHPLYQSIRFDDFDVTWAGPNPFRPGFCFGSDDGRLRFTDEEGKGAGPTFPQVASREAINGVAFHETCLAVSTRADVTLFLMNDGHAKSVSAAEVSVGAHGVIATQSGYFIAPSGAGGLRFLKSDDAINGTGELRIVSSKNINWYRVIALPRTKGEEILICALRQGGIGTGTFNGNLEEFHMSGAWYDGLDVVDICPLDLQSSAVPFAALGRDGTLILVRDAHSLNGQLMVKHQPVKGTAYRILSSRGHIFVLTNDAVWILLHLAERFLRSEEIDGTTTQIIRVATEAVDANLPDPNYLIVVAADEVLRFDIDHFETAIATSANGESLDVVASSLAPKWERRRLVGEAGHMVGAA